MGKLKFRESVTRSKIFSDLKEIYDKYFVVKVMMESSSVEKDKDESNSIKMAVKRDDPKDVILEYNGSSLFGETCYAECPVCKNNFGDLADVSVGIYVPKFCDKCGQRLAQHSWLYYHKKFDKLKKESEKGNKT